MTPFEKELFKQCMTGIQLPKSLTTLNHTIMTQYTLKTGLVMFGPPGTKGVFKEMKQLHDQKVCQLITRHTLSPNQKCSALDYLMFRKQNCTGQIKGCRGADGHKQWIWTRIEETAPPTVVTDPPIQCH